MRKTTSPKVAIISSLTPISARVRPRAMRLLRRLLFRRGAERCAAQQRVGERRLGGDGAGAHAFEALREPAARAGRDLVPEHLVVGIEQRVLALGFGRGAD